MIAYFIMVHRYPEQFKRMFRAIYTPDNHYLVHIDKNSGPALAADVGEFLASYENAEMLPSRRAMWTGYSLVDIELRGMARLLEMDENWDYFINLSGQDFPLKSQSYIRSFLQDHEDTQFIHHYDQRTYRPNKMSRIETIHVEAFNRTIHTGIRRKFIAGATPYIGNQWKIASRRFCEYACHDSRADRFKRYYRRTFVADEGFFQTIMLNGFELGPIVNDDLRSIDWIPYDDGIKLRPRVFTVLDAQALLSSRNLFGRKFDTTEDAAILDALEHHLDTPQASNYRKIPSVDDALATTPVAAE